MTVRMLAVNGVWVTGQDVFLSPGDSKMMYRKSASLSFLFEQVGIFIFR